MKLKTVDGKWVIEDNGVIKIFDKSYDAWQYILFMKEIRPKAPWTLKSLYPVNSLIPCVQKKRIHATLQN